MNESEFLKELTNLLFFYRKKRNYTISFLAKEMDCDPKFIRNLELGKHSTQINNYFKIAKRLEVPIEDIVKLIKEYYMS